MVVAAVVMLLLLMAAVVDVVMLLAILVRLSVQEMLLPPVATVAFNDGRGVGVLFNELSVGLLSLDRL